MATTTHRPARATASAGEIAVRAVAAVLGGYGVAFAATAMLALVLPLPPADAVTVATLLSFVIYIAAALWAFAARTAVRAWLGLTAVAAGCLIVAGIAL